MAFAALTIDLDARLAKFEEGMKRATSSVERSAKSMEAQFAGVANGIKAIVGLVSAGAFATMAQELVTSAAALKGLSEVTGSSVESLSKLQQIAKLGGQEFTGVTDTLVRLSRALAGADEESKGAGEALAKLGLKAAELRQLDPSEALRRVAVELNKYADGGGKAALATELLGKSGAQLLPFMKDLATQTGIAAQVTAEQAEKADQLEKALKRMSVEAYNAKQTMALGLVPTISNAIEQFNAGTKAAGGFLNAIIAFGTLNPFKSAGESLRGLRADLEGAQNQKAISIAGGSLDTTGIDGKIAAIQKRIEFLKVLERQQALAGANGDTPGERARFAPVPLPALSFVKSGGGSGAAAPRRPIESILDSLEKESLKVEGLQREYQILAEIELGLYGVVTPAEKARAQQLARIVDLTKQTADEEKRRGEEITKWADEQVRAAKEAETLAQRWRDLADPTQEQNRRLQEGLELLQKQRITIQEFNAGANPRLTSLLNPEKSDRDVLNEALKEGDISLEKYLESIKRLNGELDKTKDTSNEIFEKLSSAFEDAVINGKKFSDVLKGIGQDLLKIFIRDQITKPAGDFFKDIFKSDQPEQLGGPGFGSGGGGSGGLIMEAFNVVKGLFGFANGGEFRVGGSGGTDSQLVAFKASPNETVTVRTPAQQRQAGGEGGGITIVQNMSFGSDVNRSTLAAWADRTKQETMMAVADMTRRGGNYARAVRG